jgi:hypothetical protein
MKKKEIKKEAPTKKAYLLKADIKAIAEGWAKRIETAARN